MKEPARITGRVLHLEATPRLELGVKVLQTSALPLGYVANRYKKIVRTLERETGFGPATFTLAT